MDPILNFIVYCIIVTAVLYGVWQCVFEPIRKRRRQRIVEFEELQEEDLEYGDIAIEEGEYVI